MIDVSKNCLEKMFPELLNGVEYKTLGEIATEMYRGSGIKKDEVTTEGIPCVRYGEIYTTYGIWFDECISHTILENVASPKYFEHGDILFAITGESVEDIAKSTAYVGNDKCLAGGDIVVMKHKQNPKYLSYALSTVDAIKQKGKGKVKSKVVHSSVPAIKDILIPVPPLEIQCEIVRILDNFTELTAELTARKKQYEYYRDSLLTFNTEIPRVKLGDIATINRGIRVTRDILSENGKFPVYQNALSPLGFYDKSNRKSDTTFVISAGAAGQIGYSDVDFWSADDCFTFDDTKDIYSKYIYIIF